MDVQLVREVMTQGVVVVHPATPYRDIVEALTGYRISGVPVVDDQMRIVGVVSESDLMHNVGFGGEIPELLDGRHRRDLCTKAAGQTAAELMSTPPVTIEVTATVAEAARIMQENHVKRLPVLDAGRLVGIVSRRDVLRAYLPAEQR